LRGLQETRDHEALCNLQRKGTGTQKAKIKLFKKVSFVIGKIYTVG